MSQCCLSTSTSIKMYLLRKTPARPLETFQSQARLTAASRGKNLFKMGARAKKPSHSPLWDTVWGVWLTFKDRQWLSINCCFPAPQHRIACLRQSRPMRDMRYLCAASCVIITFQRVQVSRGNKNLFHPTAGKMKRKTCRWSRGAPGGFLEGWNHRLGDQDQSRNEGQHC